MSASKKDNRPNGARDLGELSSANVRGLIGIRDRIDYFRASLSQPSDLSLSIRQSDRRVGIRLELRDINNNLITRVRSNRRRKVTALPTQTLGAGDYFFVVRGNKRGNTRYRLVTSAAITEPGEDTFTARAMQSLPGEYRISEFVGTEDESDYYKFFLPNISDFNASIIGAGMDLYYDANNNNLIDEGEFVEDGRTRDNIARAVPGGHYFLVVNAPFEGSTQYDLVVTATPNPGNLPIDPGNIETEAYNLGDFVGTSVLKEYVGLFDDRDYYRLDLSGARSLNANITGTRRVEVALYSDTNQNGVIDSNEFVSSLNSIFSGSTSIVESLQPGTYFLEVKPGFSAFESPRYELTLSVN
jgi:hypothetical protein